MGMAEGKERLNQSYYWLKATVIQNHQLYNLLDDKKDQIRDLENQKETLRDKIQEAGNDMMKHDALVEEARSELKQTQSRKITDIEEKDNEIQECQIRLSMQKNEMKRLHEISQMAYEEELSKCYKLKLQLEQEVARSKEQQEMRNKSQSLTNQENKIDKQLSMSNPLLTDIMEFFYQK